MPTKEELAEAVVLLKNMREDSLTQPIRLGDNGRRCLSLAIEYLESVIPIYDIQVEFK